VVYARFPLKSCGMSETWVQEGQNNVTRCQKYGYKRVRIKLLDVRNFESEIKYGTSRWKN
jgi:hypothetical protein